MKLSEKLKLVAGWLASEENDLIVNAESDEHLEIVAGILVSAAEMLKNGAEEVAKTEPADVSEEMVDEMAALADELDKGGMVSEAGVLDAALAILAAEKTGGYEYDEDRRMDEIKKKYKDTLTHQHELNGVAEAQKAVKDSEWMKVHRMREAPLSTRVCPLHLCPLVRCGEDIYQCVLDRQLFDWRLGYTNNKGVKIPGGSVEGQTAGLAHFTGDVTFQSRGDKTGINQ